MITEGNCPECGHPWAGHIGNTGGYPCGWAFRNDANGQPVVTCGCRREDPASVAEGRIAAAAWNAYMGRVK